MKEVIIIYLGSGCNLNCAYCHREKEQDLQINENFLKTLKDYSGVIIFRGGEPTLYMDTIKKFVSATPKASYCITTNGVLFDNYKDYFTKNKFSVYISYDGNLVRPFDPFTKPILYDKISATSVLTKGDNLFQILDSFDKKSLIIGHRLEYYPHIGHYTYEGNKKYAMCEEDYISLLEDIKSCMNIFVDERKRYSFTNRRYYGIHRFLLDSYNHHFLYGETRCANRFTKRVDVTGQQYDCLYIRDHKLDDDWLEEQKKLISYKFPMCATCSVYDMCGAGCIKSLSHDIECLFYKNIFSWYKTFYLENVDFLY